MIQAIGLDRHEGWKSFLVDLWTVGNYHWYHKQSLEFDPIGHGTLTAFVWDPEHPHRIHIVCAGGRYLQYTWSWSTDCSSGSTFDDQATVAVIDGSMSSAQLTSTILNFIENLTFRISFVNIDVIKFYKNWISTSFLLISGKALMTPFRNMVVPPPLSAYDVRTEKPISQIAFSIAGDGALAILLVDGQLALYGRRNGGKSCRFTGRFVYQSLHHHFKLS